MIPERDDGVDAARKRAVRQEFRRIIEADPTLTRLEAATRYPRLPLGSTALLCLTTLVLAFLRDNLVVAVLVESAVLVGHLTVVHLIAKEDESGALVMLRVLRGACSVAVALLVLAAVTTPSDPHAFTPSAGVAGSSSVDIPAQDTADDQSAARSGQSTDGSNAPSSGRSGQYGRSGQSASGQSASGQP